MAVAIWISAAAVYCQAQEPDTIPLEEFQSSRFAQLFQEGRYEEALEALDSLRERYPQDPLLLRYRGIALDRLGRSEEAIAQFEDLLRRNPNHVPTRYFLGLALAHQGKADPAKRELEWVQRESPLPTYREWAKAALDQLQAGAAVPIRPQRWSLRGSAGWEWDSNVLLKPDDKSLALVGDRNADRFSANLQIGYRAVAERDRLLDLLYTTRSSFHDDGLDDFNFTSEEIGVVGQRAGRFFGQPVWWGGRYDSAVGFLKEDLFSWTNRATLSADTRLTPRTRTVLSHQISWVDFGPDGSNPPQTSRDGLYQELGLTHTLYSADFRRHLFITQSYGDARVRGGNFERRGAGSRVGFHIPLTARLTADASVGFQWNRYPRFSSLSSLDLARRRDTDWDFYAALSRPVPPRILGRFFYRFVAARNRNDFFEYDRHLAGVELYF